MQLRFSPLTLELRHAFTLAASSRTTTPAMLVELEHDGLTGYGEAAMPPYLGDTQSTATAFFGCLNASRWTDPFRTEEILAEIDALVPGNTAAKAALDIALHDWIGKKLGLPLHKLWGLDAARAPVTSFTIGIATPEIVRQKTREAEPYHMLKVKLGRDTDQQLIETIREITDKPLLVDANQGWTDREDALRMSEWLAARGVVLIEQPFAKTALDDTAWLRERSPLPLIADESAQRLTDVARLRGVFDGINIKLMKCTGLREAHRMITAARALEMKVMLGCMTETSCAISAAAQLAPLADWADLDGALLITNDPFDGATFDNGRILPSARPGIGVRRRVTS
ncbi:MAG: dipeptide epimerase [Candidatus Didemnitutus sp.]|nr:dipeptide epimerase [Candidatus Didemnitutus sp.]